MGVGSWGQGVRTPLKNDNNIGFLSKAGPDPLKSQIQCRAVIGVGPLLTKLSGSTHGFNRVD